MGSGMKRMKDVCKQENSPNPKIDYTDIHFYVTFKPSHEYLQMAGVGGKDGESIGEKDGEKLSANQKEILKYIKAKPSTSAAELSKAVGINSRNIELNLAKLKQKGLLRRVGSDKGGHWEVLLTLKFQGPLT
jgi:ATP-dependent DNA helicase RecG